MGRTGSPVRCALAAMAGVTPPSSSKPLAMASTRRREEEVGLADHGVAFVQDRRHAKMRRRQHRRHARIAAKADERERIDLLDEAARGERPARQRQGRRGPRDEARALVGEAEGTIWIARAGKAAPYFCARSSVKSSIA